MEENRKELTMEELDLVSGGISKIEMPPRREAILKEKDAKDSTADTSNKGKKKPSF